MSYLTMDEISRNPSMQVRVAQAYAAEPGTTDDPDTWMFARRRDWAAAPGWADAWESSKVSHPDDNNPNTPAYDPGADAAVITDGQILAQVQAMIAAG